MLCVTHDSNKKQFVWSKLTCTTRKSVPAQAFEHARKYIHTYTHTPALLVGMGHQTHRTARRVEGGDREAELLHQPPNCRQKVRGSVHKVQLLALTVP